MGKFLLAVAGAVVPFALGVAVLLTAYFMLGGAAFVFWACALAAIIPGVFILVSEDIVRTAFWLLCSLTGFAGFYVLLGADFLALLQVMVYLGGIMILILFGVLLTSKDPAVVRRLPRLNLIVPGLGAAAVIFAGVYSALKQTQWRTVGGADVSKSVSDALIAEPQGTTVFIIGERLLSDFVLPFEIASILLLAALVGAAYIARRGGVSETAETTSH
jgi:NADH-quinone oxidoreductase subunit J